MSRYGVETASVLALAERDPGLLEPLGTEIPALGVELSFGAAHELALTADDLIDRRTRIGLASGDRATARTRAETILEALEAATGV